MAEQESNKNVENRFQQLFWELADTTRFAGRVLLETFRGRFEWGEFWRQCYVIGLKTLGLVSITGFIMGLVLTMQTRPVMEDLGADAWLPGIIMVAIIREISPVIGGLIFAGKVGSGIGAELGSMRVTDQIDAMEVSGTNPMNYLVATRVMATTLMLPILVLYSDGVAFLGSYAGVNMGNTISLKLFLSQAVDQVWYFDLIPATIKSFFFGFAIGVISCYKGYHTTGGTQGVGVSANTAVVISSVVIFILDLMAAQITELLI